MPSNHGVSIFMLLALLCCTTQFLLLPFPYLGSAHQVFILHTFRSCASSLCTPVSSLSICKTSHILSTSVLIILSFGLTSVFRVLITVEPVLGDHPFCPPKVVAQDRWSLITGRTQIMFYRCVESTILHTTRQ